MNIIAIILIIITEYVMGLSFFENLEAYKENKSSLALFNMIGAVNIFSLCVAGTISYILGKI